MQFTDQTGHTIQLKSSPKKIVSLVPSQTELLFDLNLENRIIGVTKFCIHPKEKLQDIFKIGGTKNLQIDNIISLNPDLIIANKEENEKVQINQLKKTIPVWTSDVIDIDSALSMIFSIGEITKTKNAANQLISNIKNSFKDIENILSGKQKSVAYFIWRKPYMVAGGDTFINCILQFIGLKNIFNDSKDRYPIVNIDFIKKNSPDYIFLSSEPYPFKEKHIEEIKEFCPKSKIIFVNGEMFSWYGSRLQKTPNYIKNLISILKE